MSTAIERKGWKTFLPTHQYQFRSHHPDCTVGRSSSSAGWTGEEHFVYRDEAFQAHLRRHPTMSWPAAVDWRAPEIRFEPKENHD